MQNVVNWTEVFWEMHFNDDEIQVKKQGSSIHELLLETIPEEENRSLLESGSVFIQTKNKNQHMNFHRTQCADQHAFSCCFVKLVQYWGHFFPTCQWLYVISCCYR